MSKKYEYDSNDMTIAGAFGAIMMLLVCAVIFAIVCSGFNSKIDVLGGLVCPSGTEFDKIETHHAQNGDFTQVLCKNIKPDPIIPEYDGTKIPVVNE